MQLTVFLCHSAGDKPAVRNLHKRLKESDVAAWLDEEELIPGEDWAAAMPDVVKRSDVVVICLSESSIGKTGYVQKEIRIALDAADERPEGTIFLIPLRLEECVVPDRLKKWHYVNLYEERGYKRLMVALEKRATQLGKKLAPGPIEPPKPPVSSLDEIEAVLSRDPTISLPAAERMRAGDGRRVPELVDRLRYLDRVSQFSARSVLQHFAAMSAPLMVKKVQGAAEDWNSAIQAAECFGVAHRPFAAGILAIELEKTTQPDVGRTCIEALGWMGASDWGYILFEKMAGKAGPFSNFNKYYYEKYSSSVVESLARMFVLEERPEPNLSVFGTLGQAIRFISPHGWQSITFGLLQDALSYCRPRHADFLLKRWVSGELTEFRKLAARALGHMRLKRAIRPFLQRLNDPSEDVDVIHEAALALGNIGTMDVAAALADLVEKAGGSPVRGGEFVEWGLSMCVGAIDDSQRFHSLCERLLGGTLWEKCWIYRAIGLRRDTALRPLLFAGLHSSEASERGHAALGLARHGTPTDLEAIRAAFGEAGNWAERILCALALLVANDVESFDEVFSNLGKDLAVQSYLLKRPTREDIVNVLSVCSDPRAPSLAQAWRTIYTESLDY